MNEAENGYQEVSRKHIYLRHKIQASRGQQALQQSPDPLMRALKTITSLKKVRLIFLGVDKAKKQINLWRAL